MRTSRAAMPPLAHQAMIAPGLGHLHEHDLSATATVAMFVPLGYTIFDTTALL